MAYVRWHYLIKAVSFLQMAYRSLRARDLISWAMIALHFQLRPNCLIFELPHNSAKTINFLWLNNTALIKHSFGPDTLCLTSEEAVDAGEGVLGGGGGGGGARIIAPEGFGWCFWRRVSSRPRWGFPPGISHPGDIYQSVSTIYIHIYT